MNQNTVERIRTRLELKRDRANRAASVLLAEPVRAFIKSYAGKVVNVRFWDGINAASAEVEGEERETWDAKKKLRVVKKCPAVAFRTNTDWKTYPMRLVDDTLRSSVKYRATYEDASTYLFANDDERGIIVTGERLDGVQLEKWFDRLASHLLDEVADLADSIEMLEKLLADIERTAEAFNEALSAAGADITCELRDCHKVLVY